MVTTHLCIWLKILEGAKSLEERDFAPRCSRQTKRKFHCVDTSNFFFGHCNGEKKLMIEVLQRAIQDMYSNIAYVRKDARAWFYSDADGAFSIREIAGFLGVEVKTLREFIKKTVIIGE